MSDARHLPPDARDRTRDPSPDLAPESHASPVGQTAQWFRALVQHSSDMVLVLDATGSAVYASPSTERLLGYRAEDWNDRDVWEVVHPDDREGLRRAYRELEAGRLTTTPTAFRLRCADGSFRPVEAVASNRLEDDAVRGVVINLRDVSERLLAEHEAREADQRYRTLVASLVYGVLLVDPEGRVVVMNETLEQVLGTSATRLAGRSIVEILSESAARGTVILDEHGEPLALDEQPVVRTLRTGETITTELGIRRPGRPEVWFRSTAQAIPAAGGVGIGGVAVSFADVTATRRAAAELEGALVSLRRERNFLQVMLENLEEGIVACDEEGRLTLLNRAARRFHGVDQGADPIGRFPSALGLRRPDGRPMGGEDNPLLRALAGEWVRDDELIVENRRGERRVVVANGQALFDEDGRKVGAVVAMHDVSAMKRNEERLADLALHDPLTGVANRLLLDERIQKSLDRIREHGGGVGVFLLDLDDFKAVNDLHGHEVGDDVLTAVASRLRGTLRPEDTVARLGGDEFVVLCEVHGGVREVEKIGNRLSDALAEPYRLDGRTLVVEASVGGVLVNDPDADAGKLLGLADDDMYRVKGRRRSSRHRAAPADGRA